MKTYSITTDAGNEKGNAADAARIIREAQELEGWAYIHDEDGVLVAGYSGDTAQPTTWGLDKLA